MIDKERKLIGKGRVSSIYYDGIFAYKTFPIDYPLEWIQYEVQIQREIYEKTKLPVLKYEFIENAREIKMDMISGLTLSERMRKHAYPHGLEDLISLQKHIYEYSGLNIPKAFETFEKRLKESTLDEPIKEKALNSLFSVENKNILCHFDLHFDNIMYDGSKYFIIDWVNAKLGNPVLDIARAYIILKQYVMELANRYLTTVTRELSINTSDVLKAIPAMAALRLLEHNDSSSNRTLIELIFNNQ